MDIQITDFENTCLIVLMGLITNMINHFDVDFIIPITLSDQNMQRAHFRDAILTQKFWFNTNCFPDNITYLEDFEMQLQDSNYMKSSVNKDSKKEPKYEELFISEILCGKKESNFIGIYTVITKFMELQKYQLHHSEQIEQILEFLEARSKGEVPTGAKFIREYVLSHPLYKQDSIITPCLNRNIILQIMNLNKEKEHEICDCEKHTGSNNSFTDELFNLFENNFDISELSENEWKQFSAQDPFVTPTKNSEPNDNENVAKFGWGFDSSNQIQQ